MSDQYQVITKILNGALVTGAGAAVKTNGMDVTRTFQATVTGTGAVTATVRIEYSNDGVGWLYDATSTLALSDTTTATGGFTSNAAWGYVRANVTAVSGTGAAVTVTMGG